MKNERNRLDVDCNDEMHTVEIGDRRERTTNLVLEDPVHNDRWELIKKVAEVYDKQEKRSNGKLKWGKPLCDLELCTMSAAGNNLSDFQQAVEQSVNETQTL